MGMAADTFLALAIASIRALSLGIGSKSTPVMHIVLTGSRSGSGQNSRCRAPRIISS